ncbi:hypothetical protein [Sulfurovum sp. TSL1]|uniref:hypothetical protein n=1 Tax=Sulfurovum sp. TSL1 TaxID=2826994 RepID=UPI001CC673E1|nr:hypothetical protein [Sulfurovum sp. TSL1]GIT98798.1 hypothetical protein TSL1_16190 [Sulfurovum sp. TSL1]
MESWKCNKCSADLSTQSYKEWGGVNDTYVLIYSCDTCDEKGYTVTKNTRDIKGATVIKTFDKEVHPEEEIQKTINELNI